MRVAPNGPHRTCTPPPALVSRGSPLPLDGLITPPRPGGLGPDRYARPSTTPPAVKMNLDGRREA